MNQMVMIIVIGVSFITSMVFTDLEVIYSLRHVRFLTLFLTCILGLYGLFIGLFLIGIMFCAGALAYSHDKERIENEKH